MAAGSDLLTDATSIALAIVTVGLVATLVSRNANTAGVVNAGSSAFNTALATAEGPVTGYTPGAPIYSNQLGGLLGGGFGTPELGAGYGFGHG